MYYFFRGVDDKKNGGSGLKAFPNGLEMLAGNPTQALSLHIVIAANLTECGTLTAENANGNREIDRHKEHSTKVPWSGFAAVLIFVPRIPLADSPGSNAH